LGQKCLAGLLWDTPVPRKRARGHPNAGPLKRQDLASIAQVGRCALFRIFFTI
jgi:hypothetical protein